MTSNDIDILANLLLKKHGKEWKQCDVHFFYQDRLIEKFLREAERHVVEKASQV